MSENEATSDQDDVSFIRTDDMVCLQCSETGERVCLAAEGFGNRHCFLEPIANKNYPPEMPSCVFVIEQALSVRALQEMVTAEAGDGPATGDPASSGAGEEAANGEQGAGEQGAAAASPSSLQLTSAGGEGAGGVGGGNRTLLYGHAVLLRHLHSGMYLATLSICSSSDKLAFDVGLKQARELGESCWWTVHPGSKQRSEGEKVRVGDELILVSVATERYLHYTTSERPLTPPMASASAGQLVARQAIVNASFHSTHWSIAPFGTGLSRVKNVGYVFGGQVLRLLHGGDECLTVAALPTADASQQQQQQQQQEARQEASRQQQVDVIYEGGPVMNQARSLWRLDLIRTRWSGGFVQYSNAIRIRHITTGKYLGVNEQRQLCLLAKQEASVERSAFCLRLTKDDSKGSRAQEEKDEEVIGAPTIKYADTSFFIQHMESQMWLSYRSYETKRRGIGRVEEKQAILAAEGKMDDCLEFSRSQEEEARTARVIRKCDALFSRFIRILDYVQQAAALERAHSGLLGAGAAAIAEQPAGSEQLAAKKRNSVASSAIAAAALSGLAPLFGSAGNRLEAEQSGGQSASAAAMQQPVPVSLFPSESQVEMSKCLEDLIDYFAPPDEGCDHEQEQNRLRALRNRQDLFQEEGILNLILDAIDKINLISGRGLLVLLLGEESSLTWEAITAYFYQLLAAIIKDNHTNCSQFAQAHRLNWLFSRLSSQQASEGTGMLDVLHCVLLDSPEALNMLKEAHIRVLISLLEKHGRDPKVLNVLCSLCVSNGVAIRSSQNTITSHLLPGRNLLLQTRLVEHVASMKPNVYVARAEGSAMYHRWYYELVVDHIELDNKTSPHLRVGWANTKGYLPYPGSGSYWGTNGVGDDFYSYGFDGQYLWTAGRPTLVRIPPSSTQRRHEQPADYAHQQQAMLEAYARQQSELAQGGRQAPAESSEPAAGLPAGADYLRLERGDVIGCLLDLATPSIQFTINGKQIFGFFKNFNVHTGGFFHPVVSFSARVSCRFLLGANQGELRYRPPLGFSPLVEVLLPEQEVQVESCFSFGDLTKQLVCGPQLTPESVAASVMELVFIPRVIDTRQVPELTGPLETLRASLAENMHELWCMSRIEDDWIYGEEHDELQKTHPYLAPFAQLPALAKKYKLELAGQTLKVILALGYDIQSTSSSSQGAGQPAGAKTSTSGQRVKTYRLPNEPYLLSNGYKPAPLDLSQLELSSQLERLVEQLAENIHNIWAAEKIKLRWTYRRREPTSMLPGEDYGEGRSCHLLPYKFVDPEIKLKNRQAALESVLTVLAYGYRVGASTRPPPPAEPAASKTPGAAGGDEVMSSAGLLSPTPSAASRPASASSLAPAELGGKLDDEQLTGYESILGAGQAELGGRHYRAERTYAVHTGRWYYEVEVCSLGSLQVGWAQAGRFRANARALGADDSSWAFECHLGRKAHASNYEPFGQVASLGDVIGCMLDLHDRTISYSLNGKLMLDYLGNECAFGGAELAPQESEGYVPAISLGANQRARLCFGQDVEQLRFFTDYGLQEGYQPFCVNMHKPIALWYNKREPNFVNLDELAAAGVGQPAGEAANVEVTRIPAGSDSPPALKLAYRQFEAQERATWEYLRLSLPVTIKQELIDETDKIAKMQELQAQQLRLAYSQAGEARDSRPQLPGATPSHPSPRHPARLEQHMLQSGFSLADVKGLQRAYAPAEHQEAGGHAFGLPARLTDALGGGRLSQQAAGPRRQLLKARSVDEQPAGPPSLAVPSFTEAQRMMVPRQPHLHGSSGSLDQLPAEPAKRTTRSKSTFKSLFGSVKQADKPAGGRARSLSRQLEPEGARPPVPRISIENEAGGPAAGAGLARARSMSRADGLLGGLLGASDSSAGARSIVRRLSRVGPSLAGAKQAALTPQVAPASDLLFEQPQQLDLQQLDQASLELVDEHYYGVRIFPGQEPAHVLCGWVTSQFKQEALVSLQDVQRAQVVQSTSLITGQAEICERRECYLLNAGQLYRETHPAAPAHEGHAPAAGEQAAGRANRGMLIGCHVDLSTGQLSFTIDGKQTKYRFQLEPATKLYPAIFFQATTRDCLQFELSRTPLTLPLSAAILSLTPKHVQPQCPPRLKVQTLQSCSWSRVPNQSLRPNALKLSESRGWSMLADDPLAMLAVYIPEENRCLDVLELIEHDRLLRFHSNTLSLYGALCAQGNHKVAHYVCSSHVDQRQLLYAINSDYLSGDLRRGFADLLIALHLEFHAYGRHLTQNEFIVPITRQLCQLYASDELVHSFSRIQSVSIRTETSWAPQVEAATQTSTPYFPIAVLKRLVFQALNEAVFKGNLPIRDLPGGSNENLFVPLLKLADKLLLMGCVTDQELAWLLSLIDPETFERPAGRGAPAVGQEAAGAQAERAGLGFLAPGANSAASTWKPTILEQPLVRGQQVASKGLLQMRKLDEQVKLIICHLLHHLLDIQLRHRIESIMAFSVNFVGQLQSDQRRRYDEIKSSNMPSHLTARKTREFRCTPREQMRYILNFKAEASAADELNGSPSSEPLRATLKSLHASMMKQIKVITEPEAAAAASPPGRARGRGQPQEAALAAGLQKLLRVLRLARLTLSSAPQEPQEQRAAAAGSQAEGRAGGTELRFVQAIVNTMVKWAEESSIESKQLVRQMFHLLLRCYNGVGELVEALDNSYVVGERSQRDVVELLRVLSKVRALLAVQMGPEEEEVMRECLWTLVNNVVFFQHPDLIRILRVHENVMHVMMNTLSKRSRAASSATTEQQVATAPAAAGGGDQRARAHSVSGGAAPPASSEDDISKMVVSCCRFLCFFCRSSAKNQKAMFEHLAFLLENSNILLSRPSLRGSTPLDVAYSSLMENHELVLALRESHLEKIAIYLSRCGLQANQELLDKGYPDVGWDPVEGERYLDFLRFCVWVNGESVEENSNLVIRLLIRRPECLGPALRGEGPGLFAAIKDAIQMADSVHGDQQQLLRRRKLDQASQPAAKLAVQESQQVADEQGEPAAEGEAAEGEDEDLINMGSAILNFYCALVDLLGRCAPDLAGNLQLAGRHESIRARSILRSLVPLQDLKSAISLRFALVNPQCLVGEGEPFASTPASFMPNHKQSLVLFLERVYGVQDQETFFALLEEAFLPDMRAATMLERCPPPPPAAEPEQGEGAAPQSTTAKQEQGEEEGADEDEMTLALNRYLGNSAIPLLIREAHYFKQAENYANLLEPTLHTVYRLSKVRILTKGQRESVSDLLIALTREMQPHQLLKLLRKLTVDVAVLDESTTVALRLLTLHYERCSKYYGYSGSAQTSASGVFGTATEEERRLTMVLFTNIFDSLSLMDYDPELFEHALPCLNALACALPPDYSLTESRDFSPRAAKSERPVKQQQQQQQQHQQQQPVGPYLPQPVDTRQVVLSEELRRLAQRFSEHYHDAWASRKLDRDWSYAEQYSFKAKSHPRLKPYQLLSSHERDRYLEPIEEAMKALLAMGWTFFQAEGARSPSAAAAASSRPSSRQQESRVGEWAAPPDGPQRRELILNYNPQPVDTSNLSLSRELQSLAERSAENAHDLWARKQIEDWELRLKQTARDHLRPPILLHPLMVPYDLLTDREKRKNRDRSQELIKYLLFEGYRIVRADELARDGPAAAQAQQVARGRLGSRAGQEASNQQQQQQQQQLASRRRFAYSILDKLLAYSDTVMVKLELLKPSSNFSRRSSFKQSDRDVKFFSKVVLPLIERYFTAHRDFFFAYCGPAPAGTAPGGGGPAAASADAPGASPTGPPSEGAATGDEQAGRPSGHASVVEKEMLGQLFCKLAAILRNKLPVIGPDAKTFVRCLQVLTRALDARTLSEQAPDFVKTSMLTFFNKTAQDLSQCVHNLQLKRYNAVRAATMRTSSSLYHVHLALLPTLTALFDHLASTESGKYLLLDEIQLACQRLLASLYTLATRLQLAKGHHFSRREIERHRHAYGNCLAAFAAAYPVAFLEPELARFNRFWALGARAAQPPPSAAPAGPALEQAPQPADTPLLPSLDELMRLVSRFVRPGALANGRAAGGPATPSLAAGHAHAGPPTLAHEAAGQRLPATDNNAAIIEVIIPLLCSYLPFWHSQGPEATAAARQLGAGPGATAVGAAALNQLLRDIVQLIRRQVGVAEEPSSFNWMVAIAAHASQVIIEAPPGEQQQQVACPLLADSFLPLSSKIAQRAESIYHREELMRGYLKSAAEDTTAIEERIQEEFHLLVRDIYAFYPLLIKYVDYRRSHWLRRNASHQAINGEQRRQQPEQLLFQQVASVFDIWSNSQYFRREEQNFISQHEIDNMALIMQASNKPGRTFFQKPDQAQGVAAGRKRARRRPAERRDREREIASSLLVVALKRLLPIGMDLFEGRERELVQHAKDRFLKKDSQQRIEELVRIQLTQPHQVDPSDEFCWQHYLYSRLGAQAQARARPAAPAALGQAESAAEPQQHIVARIVDMARVFYGLHIIDHPNLQQQTGRRSCVSTQRRRVVIACFRMTSLHSLPRHRAINIFLRSYCDTWLLEENFGRERLIEDLTQTFEQAEMKTNGAERLVPRNDPLSQLIMTLSRQATTEHGSGALDAGQASQAVDRLYLQFADIFRLSCGGDEEDDDDDDAEQDEQEDKDEEIEAADGKEEEEEGEQQANGDAQAAASTIHEQEMEKQRLLFQQSRLSDRGVAEMILLYISALSRQYQAASGSAASASLGGPAAGASSGASHKLSQQTPMVLSTLKLGISILRGGNVEVQRRMLKHLKDKKDVGFFTSIQILMNACSVLDLDAFERNQKAEALGVRSEGPTTEKNMYDAEFTCKLFRFFQLLCEGHNLEFQNYLRTQAGNTSTVNVVIATVDYLLRLQESIMDFYWHYSSKEVIDHSGTENFIKAITIAKQVFCTLTESIQGPCPQNQQALANSRLWHAVGGFLFLFAHMQDKLSRNSSQLNLLIELLDLQKEMVIMMLSMLEGNVVNGTIGKQMVETLVESSHNVEIILKFFDMFLKLPRLTSSTNFQEYDRTGSGWISPGDLRKAMEQHKIYTREETQYLLSCCEPNHDGMIDYREFIDRFHQPAKDIGFNLAVLLTNLAEHITNEPRLQRFLETASTVLNYFEPYLGRIEIMGSSRRIERVYFEIKESTLDQWAKPQIQESKRAFFYSIVTEGDGKEKLEAFVNFCEDTIFEMQHASNILGEEEEQPPTKADRYPFDAAASSAGSPGPVDASDAYGLAAAAGPHSATPSRLLWLRLAFGLLLRLLSSLGRAAGQLRPARVRRQCQILRQMSYGQLLVGSLRLTCNLWLAAFKLTFSGLFSALRFVFGIMVDDGSLAKHLEEDEQQQQQLAVGRRQQARSLDKRTVYEPEPLASSLLDAQVQPGAARTELVMAPSMMTASVADVSQDGASSTKSKLADKMDNEQSLARQDTTSTGMNLDEQQASLGELEPLEDDENILVDSSPHRPAKSKSIGFRLAQLTSYNQKIVSFLARNFYRIKLLALVTAFIINFILLFYRVSVWTGDAGTELDSASNKQAGADHQLLAGAQQSGANTDRPIGEIESRFESSLTNYKNKYGTQGEQDSEDDVDIVDTEAKSKKSKAKSTKKAAPDDGGDEPRSGEASDGDEQVDGEKEEGDDYEEETDMVEWVVMEEKYHYLEPILTILASVHTLFSLCMLIAYYHLKVPLVIFKREKEIARKLEFDGMYITEEPDGENWWNGHWDKLVISADSFPVNYWDKFVKKRVREKYREQYDYEALSSLLGMSNLRTIGAPSTKDKLKGMLLGNWLANLVKVDWRYQMWKAGVTLTDQSFQYQLLYLLFSLAGHFNHFFFAAHLVDVAIGFKKLQTLLQSVTHNGKQLLLTVMLLTIVVYIYTVIAFNFFRKFYVQGDDSPDQKCHSMMTCFVYHLYQGVRSGGGIGDVIEAPDGDDYEVYRIIFDITFFFFVIIILLAILQGLIIDAFGELRDQLLTVAADMESNCFICGIGKDVLDKVPRGFDTHVQKEHNLANYMFFLMHLINKPDTDYTGQETYVWELYQRRCWDFFPVGECFRTQSEEEADSNKD